jgi:hypothetical protein|tara:strand:+ start:747 stop:1121 length:375 start_codon:yes stop_codon:yes gene_type:complete
MTDKKRKVIRLSGNFAETLEEGIDSEIQENSETKSLTVKTNDIKKGIKIKSVQLGVLVTGIMADNKKGNTRLVDVKGSEVGLFDEMGSVYSHDIILAEIDGVWKSVEHTEKQLNLKRQLKSMGW